MLTCAFMAYVKNSIKEKYLLQNINFQSLNIKLAQFFRQNIHFKFLNMCIFVLSKSVAEG